MPFDRVVAPAAAAGGPVKPTPRAIHNRLLPFLSVLGLVSISYVLGGAVTFFELPTSGPLRKANAQYYSTAQSREQAALIYQLAAKMVRLSPVLASALTLKD